MHMNRPIFWDLKICMFLRRSLARMSYIIIHDNLFFLSVHLGVLPPPPPHTKKLATLLRPTQFQEKLPYVAITGRAFAWRCDHGINERTKMCQERWHESRDMITWFIGPFPKIAWYADYQYAISKRSGAGRLWANKALGGGGGGGVSHWSQTMAWAPPPPPKKKKKKKKKKKCFVSSEPSGATVKACC